MFNKFYPWVIEKVWPVFKKLFKMFAKEIITFIFITLREKIREYFNDKAGKVEEELQDIKTQIYTTDDPVKKEELHRKLDDLIKEIESIRKYNEELNQVLGNTEIIVSKQIQKKIEESNAKELLVANNSEETISLKENAQYLQLKAPEEIKEKVTV